MHIIEKIDIGGSFAIYPYNRLIPRLTTDCLFLAIRGVGWVNPSLFHFCSPSFDVEEESGTDGTASPPNEAL